jgi:hypothetical protein
MRSGARLRLAAAATLMAAAAAASPWAAGPALAQDGPPVPQHGSAVHLGVASCASATCHGAAAPLDGGVVLQNENTTWQTLDKHAQAYAVLGNDLSKRIARNLGLKDAKTAGICLDCHADNVPQERRGPQFQLTDGVGCEACHGGSENWIRVHTINDNEGGHARNIAAGLYPTADPRARATMCLSCHLGDDTKFATHRIMGAGHPRLSFELDTFTAIEPAHFQVDDDYAQRKRVVDGVQVWAIGQAMALAQTLELVTDSKWGRTGLFPELSFFDCHSCHKPMSAARWQERASLGLGPGVVRFNDANLIMLRQIARVVAPQLGERIAQQGRALHQASQKTAQDWRSAAAALRTSSLQAVDAFAEHKFTERDLRAILDSLIREGGRGEYIDYVAAEQTTMAIGSLLASMRAAGFLNEGEYEGVQRVMDEMYAAVEKDEQYRPTVHLAALRRLQAAAR